MWNSTKKAVTVGIALATSNIPVGYELNSYLAVHHEQVVSNLNDGYWNSVDTQAEKTGSDAQLLSVSGIIGFVKTSLGLPNKDIASIFGVTRQTLHTYSKGGDAVQTLNRATKERALTLNEIVNKIAPKFSRSPGAMAKNYTFEGESLIQLLTSDNLEVVKIIRLSEKLSESMNGFSHSNPHSDRALHSLTRTA
jgi:hypothetical protein